MLAWIRWVELETVDPWIAIEAQRPVCFEMASRWRPKLSGTADIKTSSPDAASRNAASKWRSKNAPVSTGLVEIPQSALRAAGPTNLEPQLVRAPPPDSWPHDRAQDPTDWLQTPSDH